MKKISTFTYDNTRLFYFILIVLAFSGCTSLIKVDPPFTSVNVDNVFKNDITAISVVNDILSKMSEGNKSYTSNNSNLFLFAGLTSDELTLYAKNNTYYNMYYFYAYNSNTDLGFWAQSYYLIFCANTAIDGLSASSNLTPAVKQQLIGEAKFIRAFCYFFLVNLYGDVPLALSTDPLVNALLSRSPIKDVYSQIERDLQDAIELLSEDFRAGNIISSTIERVRPTKWAAKALLARVFLYNNDYAQSLVQSTSVIDKTDLFQLDSLDKVFLKNSNESIWQLQNITNTGGNTMEGTIFILPSTGPDDNNYPVYVSRYLLQSFEKGDQRRLHWIDSMKVDSIVYYYPYKYKSGANTAQGTSTENQIVLRLGEQYLIRAEANWGLGNIQAALDDLNVIRKRAGLGSLQNLSKSEVFSAILHERQIELFTEWGHRWLDLKRTNTINDVISKVAINKGITWKNYWALWPIAISELEADPKLVQNLGY